MLSDLGCRVNGQRFADEEFERWVGGVNQGRSHFRLAKFRSVMYRGDYSAAIGLK
jgi:hypothetical protein